MGGSFSGTTNQEMTGFFDASAALSASIPYTPQSIYDASDAKHLIVNNQMKGSAGQMYEGFYYSSQTHFLELANVDWDDTSIVAPHVLDATTEAHYVSAYGRF